MTSFTSRINPLAGYPVTILYGSPRWPSWSEWDVPGTSEPPMTGPKITITEQTIIKKSIAASLSRDAIEALIIQAIADQSGYSAASIRAVADFYVDTNGEYHLTAIINASQD